MATNANDYISLKKKLEIAKKTVETIESKLAAGYADYVKAAMRKDFDNVQNMFGKPIKRIIATEYIADNGGWRNTVYIESEHDCKEYIVGESDNWIYAWNEDNKNIFIPTTDFFKELIDSLQKIYEGFPFFNKEYI